MSEEPVWVWIRAAGIQTCTDPEFYHGSAQLPDQTDTETLPQLTLTHPNFV